MIGRFLMWVWVVVSTSLPAAGQLDLLTLREAESLIERVPEIVKLRKAGECPGLSPTFDGPEEIYFQLRRSCGPFTGQLIDNYVVNRRTGEVTTADDRRLPAADAAGKLFAAQLVQRAKQRILSSGEAHCLAHEAARARPGWDAADGAVSVERFGLPTRPEYKTSLTSRIEPKYKTTLFLRNESIQVGAMLTVNRRNAIVRDEQTGAYLMSRSLGEIVSELYALRTPVWLSDAEAAQVARLVPRVANSLRPGCKLSTGGAFYSRQAILGVDCKEGSIRESIVLVDLETGLVSDDVTGASVGSQEARRLAERFLSEARARRQRLIAEIEKACAQ